MLTVLVVDDDPFVCEYLKNKLEATNRLRVLTTTDGREAVRIAEAEQPNLVLCDIDMPEMDGVSVGHAMESRDTTKAIPFLLLSSLVTPRDVGRGVKADKWPMLSKQAPIADLIRDIEAAAAGSPGGQRLRW